MTALPRPVLVYLGLLFAAGCAWCGERVAWLLVGVG